MKFLLHQIRRYAANDDPRTATANSIALIILSNQPFYPLYVYALVGRHGAPALLTLLSSPLFFAVPAVSRRHRLAGRALLCIASLANTSLSASIMGPASGIELFYLPCLLIAALLFGRTELWAGGILSTLTALLYWLFVYVRPFAPLFSPEDAHALARMNGVSALILTAFLCFLLVRAIRAPSARNAAP